MSREINHLKKGLIRIGELAKSSISDAYTALKNNDSELAKEVIKGDQVIDELEVELEENCLKVIALNQPVAIDLRYITAILKINNDLERIADHSVNIAERSLDLNPQYFPDLMKVVEEMVSQSQIMVSKALDSFINLNTHTAYQVWEIDNQLDQNHREMFQKVEGFIRNDIDNISSYIRFLSIARYLERVGDLATNIAEDVFYTVTGEIFRHQMHHLLEKDPDLLD